MPYKNIPAHLQDKMCKCVEEVRAKGHSEDSAIAICYASIMGGNMMTEELFASYPWDKCISDQMARYGNEETARKVCGMIKAKYGGSPIQLPSQAEFNDFISRTEKELGVSPKNAMAGTRFEVLANDLTISTIITIDEMQSICPKSAEVMRMRGIKEIQLFENPKEYKIASMGAIASMPEWGSMYLIDEYIAVQPGEPYRLFPFGRLVKNGKVRDITPEYARTFRLPHFRPPIKLGSHKETTPAGGFITGLEVREDGLYANVEWNDKGDQAVKDGAYRYQSPEVIWDDSGLEDPKTGEMIPGPMILGDALLHTPHLGEDAALYTIEQIMPVPQAKGDDDVMADELEEKKGVINRLTAWLFPRPAEPEEPEPQPTVEELEAAKAEATRLEAEAKQKQAELDKLQAEQAHKERVDSFAAQVKEFGIEDKAGEMLAALSDEAAGWFITQFSALHEQIKLNDRLTEEIGSEKTVPTDQMSKQEQLNAAIMAKAKEINPDKPMAAYSAALAMLAVEKPELF